MDSTPGLHRFVIPLPLGAARSGWDSVAEPWMVPVELEPVGPLRTVATVHAPSHDHDGYDTAFRTARSLGEFVRATRTRRSRSRRGEVLPPVGPASGAVLDAGGVGR
jgi:hypothetical protein